LQYKRSLVVSARVLYLTADAIGAPTGGGVVTEHESRALAQLGDLAVWSFPDAPRPWGADDAAHDRLRADESFRPSIAHAYSGTFTRTVELLKERGCRVTYTCAAHDTKVSREEHARLGLSFDYPHLTDPELWQRYVEGYRCVDTVVCPSEAAAAVMRSYGCEKIAVIPHGVVTSTAPRVPLPARFAVAYLGQAGPDKGLSYLLEAWKLLGYADVLLTIAGRGTEVALPLVRQSGGMIYLRGAVDNVDEIYDTCTLYVQPSATEGFGIEVLEAMSRGRPVLCSTGAGACDVVRHLADQVVPARDARALADRIDSLRAEFAWRRPQFESRAENAVEIAQRYAWASIRDRYVALWRAL
jgi:glycosyltransferase involved in cell wall biosynthesis